MYKFQIRFFPIINNGVKVDSYYSYYILAHDSNTAVNLAIVRVSANYTAYRYKFNGFDEIQVRRIKHIKRKGLYVTKRNGKYSKNNGQI